MLKKRETFKFTEREKNSTPGDVIFFSNSRSNERLALTKVATLDTHWRAYCTLLLSLQCAVVNLGPFKAILRRLVVPKSRGVFYRRKIHKSPLVVSSHTT